MVAWGGKSTRMPKASWQTIMFVPQLPLFSMGMMLGLPHVMQKNMWESQQVWVWHQNPKSKITSKISLSFKIIP
jgi:hypothetical protein